MGRSDAHQGLGAVSRGRGAASTNGPCVFYPLVRRASRIAFAAALLATLGTFACSESTNSSSAGNADAAKQQETTTTPDGLGDDGSAPDAKVGDVANDVDVSDVREDAGFDVAPTCTRSKISEADLPLTTLDCIERWEDYPCEDLALPYGEQRLVAVLANGWMDPLLDNCDGNGAVDLGYRVGKDRLLTFARYPSGRLYAGVTDAAGRLVAKLEAAAPCKWGGPAGHCCDSGGVAGKWTAVVAETSLLYTQVAPENHNANVVVGMTETPRWAALAYSLVGEATTVPGNRFRIGVFGEKLEPQTAGFLQPKVEKLALGASQYQRPVLTAGLGDTLLVGIVDSSTHAIFVQRLDDQLKVIQEMEFAPPADVMQAFPLPDENLRLAQNPDWQSFEAPFAEYLPGRFVFSLVSDPPPGYAYVLAEVESPNDSTYLVAKQNWPMNGKEPGWVYGAWRFALINGLFPNSLVAEHAVTGSGYQGKKTGAQPYRRMYGRWAFPFVGAGPHGRVRIGKNGATLGSMWTWGGAMGPIRRPAIVCEGTSHLESAP